MKDSNDNNFQPEAKKWREFWILIGEQDDIVFTKPSHMKNAEKYIHVIEIDALNELRTQLAAAKEEVEKLKADNAKASDDLRKAANLIDPRVESEITKLTEKLRVAKEDFKRIHYNNYRGVDQSVELRNIAEEALAKLEGKDD